MKVITKKEALAQGLKDFFTGKPCKRGHVAPRGVSNGDCRECRKVKYQQNKEQAKADALAWYAANKERASQRSKVWYANNRDRARARGRAYREENLERTRERDRIYRLQNKDKEQARKRAWAEVNPGRDVERVCRWRGANPEKARASDVSRTATRRANLRAAAVPLTATERAQIKAIYELRATLSRQLGTEFHVDHRVPISKGGKHHPSNLWVIPASENLRKSARLDWTQAAA